MIELPLAYWVGAAVGVALLLTVVILLVTRRRHVEIAPPTLDDGPVGPTLTRRRVDTPVDMRPPVADPPPAHLATEATADDLSRLKGVGPKLVARLNELGVYRYRQIADWSHADVARLDTQLGQFAGRAVRDRWVEQARLLANDDVVGFEAEFGRINPSAAGGIP